MTNEPQKEASAPVGCSDWLGEETNARKVLIALSALCILIFCGVFIAAAFIIHLLAGLCATGFVAWWIGSSIAQVLKEFKKPAAPNRVDMPPSNP